MNWHNHETSLDAYRDLKLGEAQIKVATFIWGQGAAGATQGEAELAMRSPDMHKRFAELEAMWAIRRNGQTRPNPRTGKSNMIYIGTPTLRLARRNLAYMALFDRVSQIDQEIDCLASQIRHLLRDKRKAKLDLYKAAFGAYGPDWPDVNLDALEEEVARDDGSGSAEGDDRGDDEEEDE